MRRMRTVIIAILVVLLCGTALMNLEIEASKPLEADSPDLIVDTEPAPEATVPMEEPEQIPSVGKKPNLSETELRTSTETVLESSDEEEKEERMHTCTVEIRCDTVVDTLKLENEAVIPYIPEDGVILPETVVEFTPGETAFDVLKRATRDHDVQLEFCSDKLYTGGISIEGIGYLYDFDAGPLSGWMYKVNEQFPNRGTAGYYVNEGDTLIWVYTCDLGADVGDNSVW